MSCLPPLLAGVQVCRCAQLGVCAEVQGLVHRSTAGQAGVKLRSAGAITPRGLPDNTQVGKPHSSGQAAFLSTAQPPAVPAALAGATTKLTFFCGSSPSNRTLVELDAPLSFCTTPAAGDTWRSATPAMEGLGPALQGDHACVQELSRRARSYRPQATKGARSQRCLRVWFCVCWAPWPPACTKQAQVQV